MQQNVLQEIEKELPAIKKGWEEDKENENILKSNDAKALHSQFSSDERFVSLISQLKDFMGYRKSVIRNQQVCSFAF